MGFFSSLLCMFGGIFCLSFYCKKINENLEEEVIIIKIKRSDIVDENGNPLNTPPQYTEIENNITSNRVNSNRIRDSEEIPLLENEVTNEEPNEEPPQYVSNEGSINQSCENENRETNINSEDINNSINNSIYNTNINNISTVGTTSNIVYNNALNSER